MIRKFLMSNNILQSLRLSFYDWRHPGASRERPALLSYLFSKTPFWPNLCHLALEGLATSQATLELLLNAHHATLRSFSLGHITTVPSRENLPLEDHRAILILFLADRLQLQQFNFCGDLMLGGVATLTISAGEKEEVFGLENG
jgi:hypothetical protein